MATASYKFSTADIATYIRDNMDSRTMFALTDFNAECHAFVEKAACSGIGPGEVTIQLDTGQVFLVTVTEVKPNV